MAAFHSNFFICFVRITFYVSAMEFYLKMVIERTYKFFNSEIYLVRMLTQKCAYSEINSRNMQKNLVKTPKKSPVKLNCGKIYLVGKYF